MRATTLRSKTIANSVSTHQEDEDPDDLEQRPARRVGAEVLERRLVAAGAAGSRRTSADLHDGAGARPPSVGRTVEPGRVRRQPDHPVRHRRQPHRQGDRAGAPVPRSAGAVGHAEPAAVAGDDTRHRRPARCRPGPARRPAACRGRAAAARSPAPPRRGRPAPASAAADRRVRPRRGPAGGAQRGELGAGRLRVGSPRSTSISSASPCSTRPSGSAPVPCRVASNGRGPALPVQVTCRPSPTAGATGSTTSACSVTAAGGISRLTTKPTRSSAASAGRRVGQVVDVDAADQQRGSSPSRAAVRMPVVSRPGVAGSSRAPDRARPRRGRRRRRPGGRRAAASAAHRPRPRRRSPARRGTQASRAPVRGGQPGRGGEQPGHLGQPLADQDHRAGQPQRLGGGADRVLGDRTGRPAAIAPATVCAGGSAGSAVTGASRPGRTASARSTRGSSPGTVASSVPNALRTPSVSERREREQPLAALAGGLAQPQEDDRRLLLGLEAGQQHRRRRLQLAVGDRAGLRARPGDPGGEEGQLLRAECGAGPGVDVVGAQRHPGELRVRVGVLDGQPAAGQHADAAGVARLEQPLRGPLQRLGPGRRRPARRSARRGPAGWSAGRSGRRSGTRTGPCRSSTPR